MRERACPRRNRRGFRRFCARSLRTGGVAVGVITGLLGGGTVTGLLGVPAAFGDPAAGPTPTPGPITLGPLPPPIDTRLVTGPVTTLRPGAPFMADVAPPGRVPDSERSCLLGFLITRPDGDEPGRPGFLTAAQCADGVDHTPVAVTKTLIPGEAFEQTVIGEYTALPAGDLRPTLPEQPWTIPISPLAVVAPPAAGWPLPVDPAVNGRPPAVDTVATAASAWGAPASWTDSFGRVVTGRVLDPAGNPELATIPAGVERVVIAADAPLELLPEVARGSAVTAVVGGVTSNLGIITGVDAAHNRLVVDLIAPFLAGRHARLA